MFNSEHNFKTANDWIFSWESLKPDVLTYFLFKKNFYSNTCIKYCVLHAIKKYSSCTLTVNILW